MQRLILLRHGKAESTSPSGADVDRSLNDRGRQDAGLMAEALARAGLAPNFVLVSGAQRTRETWGALAPSFPDAQVRIEPALYLASADLIARLVEQAGEPEGCLLVIGHNPGLHELALSYANRDGGQEKARLERGFPTSAAAIFVENANGRWSLDQVLSPQAVRGPR